MRQDGKPPPARCPDRVCPYRRQTTREIWAVESEQLDEGRDTLRRKRGRAIQKRRYGATKVAAGKFERSEGNGR